MIRDSEFRIPRFCFLILIAAGAVAWVLGPGELRADGTPYTSSAHGDQPDGVNRTSMSSYAYPTGHCAHCHEQHASVGGVEPDPDNDGPDVYLCFRNPFANQRAGFCIKCHKGQNSSQYGGFITNYDYSQRRGGESKTCPTDIKYHFRFINYDTRLPQNNCGSSVGSAHDLKNIRNDALQGNWGWGSGRELINPCLGCHNVHRATAEYPCSLPSGHENKFTWEIWGDESGEKMADYVGSRTYQPPYKVGKTTYERDADNQPDYNTLCLECHGKEGGLPSAQHGSVIKIEWGTDVRHGTGVANYLGMQNGPIRLPYDPFEVGNYVLCCTDCHEPHGSRNEWLLRTEINGEAGIEVNQSQQWFHVCNSCHEVRTDTHAGEGTPCGPVCHGHGPGRDF